MKFIVIWFVLNSYTSGIEIKPDEYGILPSEAVSIPAIALIGNRQEWFYKFFDSEQLADEFIDKAPRDVKGIYKAKLENVTRK